MNEMNILAAWQPPAAWTAYETIDMHTAGEPLRVITAGLPDLPGATLLEKRRWFAENLDGVRRALMLEPRGHADMYGAVLTSSRDADFGVFFLHNEGYSTMCGHAIIALTRLVRECGLVPANKGDIIFDVPCGRIEARASVDDNGDLRSVFRNVPSYVTLSGGTVDVQGIGSVNFDIAYGGAYYAIVDAGPLKLELEARNHDQLIDWGRRIKHAVTAAVPIVHEAEPELGFLYGTIFTGPPADPRHHSRNVCIFADGEVDRSPTGSGVSARAALHFARGELGIGQTIRIESILGTTMDVTVVESIGAEGRPAVIPEVSGTANFIGRSSFWLEPDDDLAGGFIFR